MPASLVLNAFEQGIAPEENTSRSKPGGRVIARRGNDSPPGVCATVQYLCLQRLPAEGVCDDGSMLVTLVSSQQTVHACSTRHSSASRLARLNVLSAGG